MSKKIHIGKEIKQKLDTQQRSISWLAKQIHSDPSNLHKQLKQSHIHSELLYRISVALNDDFFAPYSRELTKNKVFF